MTTSREQFEAYGLSKEGGLGPGHLIKGENGEYLNFAAQCYWDFWQASRQAVVVEIKEAAPAPRHSSSYQEGMADGAEAATTAAIEAIQAAGLRCEVQS